MNSSLSYTGTTTPSVSDLALSASAAGVGQSRMSPEAREDAIVRAGHLVEFFQAERECFEALHARTGCFGHKGSADAARLNARKAGELMAALINGRSPEYVARLEQERGLA